MKANFKVGNGRLTFEVTGQQAKEIWQQVSQIEELFCAETKCGLCGCQELRYGHRVTMKGTKPCHWYELVCRACEAQFSFGQRQDTGELFPKRRHHETKKDLPNGGWRKWEDRGVDPDEGVYSQEPTHTPPQVAPARAQQPPPQQARPNGPPPAGARQQAQDLNYEYDTPPPPRASRY